MEYGILDIPPIREMSTLLVKMIEEINLGIPDNPKIIHFAASLSKEKKDEFVKLFLERHINFSWS